MPFPNSGEMESLEALITKKAIQFILYKNLVVPTDGSLTAASLQEMPTGGGRGYAPIQLSRVINFNVLTALQWFIGLNASGDAQAQYDVAPQQWTMAAQEVVDGNTVQGVAGYCWMLPFTGGAIEPVDGATIYGAHGSAVVTAVVVTSGTFGGGTAAGFLYLETKTGYFVNGENLTNTTGGTGTIYAVSASGTLNGGDAWKQLIFLAAMKTPVQVTQVGQPFESTPILSFGSDPTLS